MWKFNGHTLGKWQTEKLGEIEVSSRARLLAFVADKIEPESFLPVGAINEDEFLGVSRHLLICWRAIVAKLMLSNQLEDSPRFWSITFELEEHAALGWNEVYEHVGEGKFVKKPKPINPLFQFGTFFGNGDFPVTGTLAPCGCIRPA